MDYPGALIFERLFGSFNTALERAGFSKEQNTIDKGKKAERIIKNSLNILEDSSLKNWYAPYDLICSKGFKVDVKGSSLHIKYLKGCKPWLKPTRFWAFNTKQKLIIDYYMCLGFDNKYEKLKHVWIFKNDMFIKSKHIILIDEKKIKKYSQYEWDSKKCNLNLTLDSFLY